MHYHSSLTHCVLCLIWTAEWQSHSGWKGPWRALASDRVNTECRSGCSGLYWLHRRWRFLGLSAQPVSMLSYPHNGILFLISSWNVSWFGLCQSSSMSCCAGSGLISLMPVGTGSCWSVPLKPNLPQAGQAQLPQPTLTGQVLQPQPSQWAYAELAPVYQHPCCPGPKTGCKNPV